MTTLGAARRYAPPPMDRARAQGRIRSLDGLRGIAASVVVIHHLLLASVVSLAAVYLTGAHPVGLARLLSYTPLHIIWAGPEFVIVFFVLSGLVLSLAAAAGARFIARQYYPNRFIRLYVPVWGSLIVGAVAHVVISHASVHGATWWLNHHHERLTLHRAAYDSTLVYEAGDPQFSGVLWSLRWEVYFSILLPVFLFVGSKVRFELLTAATLGVILVGATSHQTLHYLPPFMLGVALAYGRDRLRAWMTPARAWSLLGLAVIGLTADWWLRNGFGRHVALMLVAAGAMCAVAVAMCPGFFADFLNRRPVNLVGKRSFSLYLVHEPVIVATAFALGGKPSPIVLAVVALPVIAIVTELFYRGVERPAHNLAREIASRNGRVGRRIVSADGAAP